MSAVELPLFPLGMVMFPGGRAPLQIFEPRYMDMIKACLRDDSVFGISLISSGREVQLTGADETRVHGIGCTARVVDWDALPHGRLGVTVAGERRYRFQDCRRQSDGLMIANVEMLPELEDFALSGSQQRFESILRNLFEHPMIAGLGISVDFGSAAEVSGVLAQLLPIEEWRKQALLEYEDLAERCAALEQTIEELGG